MLGAIAEAIGGLTAFAGAGRSERDLLRDPSVWKGRDGYMLESPLSSAGQIVTPRSVKAIAAVYCCCKVLSEDVAALPFDLFRRGGDDSRVKAREHPLWSLIHEKPNPSMTAFEFREQMMWATALRGNSYAEIVMGSNGYPEALWPMPNDLVQVRALPGGGRRRTYLYSPIDADSRVLTQSEVLHIRGVSEDGLRGLFPYVEQKTSWGMALAELKYGATLWRKGAKIGGVMVHPGQVSENARAKLNKMMEDEVYGLENAGRVLTLEEGVKFIPTAMKTRDAEWIKSRQFSVIEVCRAFRMPPHKIQSLDRATFTNIEHQNIEYVQDTLQPWLVRWEQAVNRQIVDDPEFYAEFNVTGRLRGDTTSRFEAYDSAIRAGWMTRNEVRKRENLSPLDGLDDALLPSNMQPPVSAAALARALIRLGPGLGLKIETIGN